VQVSGIKAPIDDGGRTLGKNLRRGREREIGDMAPFRNADELIIMKNTRGLHRQMNVRAERSDLKAVSLRRKERDKKQKSLRPLDRRITESREKGTYCPQAYQIEYKKREVADGKDSSLVLSSWSKKTAPKAAGSD